jgi:hypothetical protein
VINVKAAVVEKEKDVMVYEVEEGYSVSVAEIPGDMNIEEFYKSTYECENVSIEQEDHVCAHSSPTRFDRFRAADKIISLDDGDISEGGDRRITIFYGRVAETERWEVAAIKYNSSDWYDFEAREHCKRSGGIAFRTCQINTSERVSVIDQKVEDTDKDGDGVVVKSVRKSDDERRLVYGVVLEPGEVDLQGDFETPEEIEKAAHRFMIKMWENERPSLIGAEHKEPIPTAVPVESYIAQEDVEFPLGMVKKGSWVVVSYIPDEAYFNKIKSGEYTGYSIQGKGRRRS